MKFEFIKHKDSSKDILKKIAFLKNQHWCYTIQSQLDWMDDNLNPDDTHLCLYGASDTELVAYLCLKKTCVCHDGRFEKILGFGNVCTSLKNKGIGVGYFLMKLGEAFVLQNKVNAILLCKDTVRPFYIKCGWKQYNGDIFYDAVLLKNTFMFAFQALQAKQIMLQELF